MSLFSISYIYAATYPSISKQPQDVMVTVGSSAAFTIVSTGAVPLAYQWQKNANTNTYLNIPGASSDTYTLDPTLITDNGSRFRCVVTNTYGRAISNPGILFVNPIISTEPVQTVNILTDYQLNSIKEGIWISVFRKIANLDDSYFVGIATGDWALNTSSHSYHWVPISVDTTTNSMCFYLKASTASWNDTFKMNIITALFNESFDDVTYPYDSIESLAEARKLGRFH